jgi:superfamily II DNA/RNA helicase
MDLEIEVFKIDERMPGIQLFEYVKSMSHGAYSLVLATNTLKFGIDATNVELVIDFEVPISQEEMLECFSSKFLGKRSAKFIHLVSSSELVSLRRYAETGGFSVEEMV